MHHSNGPGDCANLSFSSAEKLAKERPILAFKTVVSQSVIGSLPMYDWPKIRTATDAWWHGIARHIGVDCSLTRTVDYSIVWRRDDLLFSQTCGYPFTHDFAQHLQLIATPHYDADGCSGPNYCSMVFARAKPQQLGDLKGAIAAVNMKDSMSGMLALKLVFAPFARAGRFFRGAIESGSHIASLQMVRDGNADVCAVDSVCVALAHRHHPELFDGLVEIARSPSVPGLPYVTSSATSADNLERLRAGLASALTDPALAEPRNALLITGASLPARSDYTVIPALEQAMEAQGGVDLI
jgi:ABC-type phosphate/phosphonate transport system substrate-binding protein